METPREQTERGTQQSFGLLTGLAAVLVIVGETAGVFLLLTSTFGPQSVATIAGTAVVAGVLVGSVLVVLRRPSEATGASGNSTLTRAAELTVSITLLTLVTSLAFVGGLVLALVAALGGPDPQTADGDRLRDRLLRWSDENRAFIRANGQGELPLEP